MTFILAHHSLKYSVLYREVLCLTAVRVPNGQTLFSNGELLFEKLLESKLSSGMPNLFNILQCTHVAAIISDCPTSREL